MKLGKVIGKVISTQHVPNVEGIAILIVQQIDEKLNPLNRTYACADAVNANPSDIVLTCSSSSSRMPSKLKQTCIDHSIVAIVDMVSSKKEDYYKKES